MKKIEEVNLSKNSFTNYLKYINYIFKYSICSSHF